MTGLPPLEAIENEDWVAKSVELMAETTADEVPAQEEEETEGEEAETEAKPAKAPKAKEAKPAKKPKKG